MRRKELSERIERHMERGEELMQLNRAAFDRNTQAFERVMAVLDRHEQLFEESRGDREDIKVFVRDMNRRSERVVQDLLKGHGEFLAKLSAELNGRHDAIMSQLKEVREESRAQTQALLAVIDRLPPPQVA
jgi:hypothetical protein